MIRHRSTERPNWREKIESLGLTFNFIPAENCPLTPYWTEDAFYEFSSECVDMIRDASKSLHAAALATVAEVCRHEELLKHMHVPQEAWPIIKASFYDEDRESLYLYGRFDLCVDPSLQKKPKMYEYNADTPTILLESSVVQADWLLDKFSSTGGPMPLQFNNIHQLLVERWKMIAEALERKGQPKTVHFRFEDLTS
jgi:glutathionylspermidine synthase